MPGGTADIEIRQGRLFGKFSAQVGDYVLIRCAHLRRLEMIERKDAWGSGKWGGRDRNRRDPGEEILIGGILVGRLRTSGEALNDKSDQ